MAGAETVRCSVAEDKGEKTHVLGKEALNGYL